MTYGYPQNTEPRAWLVTEYNTKSLSFFSPIPETVLLANPYWVLVEDWSLFPRFVLLPHKEFRRNYPDLHLIIHSYSVSPDY